MNASNPASTIVTCPKCFGTGKLRHFAHIENGVCLLCRGAGTVTQAAAGRWLAAQMAGDVPAAATSNASRAPARPCKIVDLGQWGRVRIVRLDDGTFAASGVVAPDSDYDYSVAFSVTAGSVAIDTEQMQHGMVRHWRALQAALQSAYRG